MMMTILEIVFFKEIKLVHPNWYQEESKLKP